MTSRKLQEGLVEHLQFFDLKKYIVLLVDDGGFVVSSSKNEVCKDLFIFIICSSLTCVQYNSCISVCLSFYHIYESFIYLSIYCI